jgi:zinc transporter 1/2/3
MMGRIHGAMGVAWCAMLLAVLELCEGHADHEVSNDGDVNLRARSLVVTKCAALAIVFAVAFLGSIFPYFFRKSSSFLLLGTQFAGGVFLSTALMHFLSDSDVTFKLLLPSAKYSFAAMFTVIGYLLTMLADVLVHRVYNHRAFQQLRKEDPESATEGNNP